MWTELVSALTFFICVINSAIPAVTAMRRLERILSVLVPDTEYDPHREFD